MSYTITPLSLKNLNDLCFLYKKVFNNDVSLEMISKKFETSYTGISYFGHLAYSNKKPVAFHGAIPIIMTYNGKEELAAQYGDAMTLKEHTGNGLFTKLGKLTDTKLKEAGVKFVWGFPNQNSEYGYMNKLNWKYVDRTQGFILKTNSIPIEKFAQKFNFTKNILQRNITSVFEKHKTNKIIKSSVLNEKEYVTTLRNKAYYDYKSFTGNFKIDIDGVLFWIKIKNGLLVGDIESPNEKLFFQALQKLKLMASNCGIGELVFQASPNTSITKLLDSLNVEKFESWAVGYKNFNSNFPLEKIKLTFGDLDTF